MPSSELSIRTATGRTIARSRQPTPPERSATYAVVNHLSFAEPVADATIDTFRDAIPRMLEAGSLGVHVVEVDDRQLILDIFSESRETSDRITETIGSPFMREHVVNLLDGATQRSVGEVVVSSEGAV